MNSLIKVDLKNSEIVYNLGSIFTYTIYYTWIVRHISIALIWACASAIVCVFSFKLLLGYSTTNSTTVEEQPALESWFELKVTRSHVTLSPSSWTVFGANLSNINEVFLTKHLLTYLTLDTTHLVKYSVNIQWSIIL